MSEQIVLQIQTPYNPYQIGGTLEGWEQITIWAEGNSRLTLALSAAFVPPLLQFIGHENFGFNIVGKSSSGKTTALLVAASVWGKGSTGQDGYTLNWNSTVNGLEGVAALHNDTLLPFDEMGQASAQTISAACYRLINGMGKSRANRDGSAKPIKVWRCVLLSTGEKGVAEKIGDEGGKVQAGQLVRIIEIPADAEVGYGLFDCIHEFESAQAFADALKQATATHYGHAARAFIKAVQENRELVIQRLRDGLSSDRRRELLPLNNVDGEVKRVAGHFLITIVAAELAIEFGILNWAKEAPFSAIQECFNVWLTQRGGIDSDEDMALIEKVKSMLIQHGSSRFQDIEKPQPCNNRLGFKTKINDKTVFYMPPETFKSELGNHKNAAKVLYEAGLLIKGDGRNYPRKPSKKLPEIGNKRCYTFALPDDYAESDVNEVIGDEVEVYAVPF
jgi:putative DNA primase/helicase